MKNNTKAQMLIKGLVTVLIVALFLGGIYALLKYSGVLDKIDDIEDLKNTINSYGSWGFVVLFIIQLLQTTIVPLPSFITTIAGVLVFGAWPCFFISLLAIITGSIISFFAGRYLGKGVIKWIVGEKQFESLEAKLTKGKYAYFLMMMFPLFPDDVLCIMAGVTKMSFRFFFFTNILTRPISLLCLCFLGSGTLIPFSGWGIPVWIVLIIALAILMCVAIKYQKEIENFITNTATKLQNRSKSKQKNKQ